MKTFKRNKGKPSGEADARFSKKFGANYDQRREWSDAVNAALNRMRDAVRAGREEAANEHGDEANRLYLLGPAGYARQNTPAQTDSTETLQS